MSALLHDDRLGPARPQLGALLVERGLLSEAQLEHALAEQSSSGRQLGEILIALGFVSATMIAQALATQHGGMLKTEYGFATGFDPAAPSGSPTPPPPARPTPIVPAPAPIPAPAPPDLPPAAAAPAPAVQTPLPVEARPDEIAAAAAAVAELERRLAELEANGRAQVAALERRIEEAVAEVGTLTHERGELTAALDKLAAAPAGQSLSVDAETFTNRIAELEEALVVELARKTELEAAVAERDDRLRELEALVREQPWASSERHLVFHRGPSGYALSEHDGPPPLPGARIEVAGSDGLLVVTRVAPAPLPGHALPCAYLVAA